MDLEESPRTQPWARVHLYTVIATMGTYKSNRGFQDAGPRGFTKTPTRTLSFSIPSFSPVSGAEGLAEGRAGRRSEFPTQLAARGHSSSPKGKKGRARQRLLSIQVAMGTPIYLCLSTARPRCHCCRAPLKHSSFLDLGQGRWKLECSCLKPKRMPLVKVWRRGF